MQTGLTLSPLADTASPAANILRAALMSRSWRVPHCGHVHSRTAKGMALATNPQLGLEQRLLLGYQRSMPISSRPYQRALYDNCLTNSDQRESPIDLDRQRFFCMFLTARLSTAITWFSFISRVESLCRKSLRESAILACSRATFRRAFARPLEPFCFLASLRDSVASFCSLVRKCLGVSIFSPLDRMAKWVNPRSIPTLPAATGFAATASSQSNDTKYRPARSLDTVMVVSLAALGGVRDQRIASGSSILASLSVCPSLRLNVGYPARLAKKLVKAVCRWRKACCTGTELTSFSHAVSGCFFSAVSAADVS